MSENVYVSGVKLTEAQRKWLAASLNDNPEFGRKGKSMSRAIARAVFDAQEAES